MSRETRRQIEFLRADIGTLKAMLAERQGESMAARLSRFGLEQRLEVAEAELAALEVGAGHEPERAHVEMTFRGDAVVGSEGIEAGFAGSVARQYPSLVRAMRRKNFPRKRGGAQQPPEPRLLLTGTAQGSFGLVFEEEALEVAPDEQETPLYKACEQVGELLEELTRAEAPMEVFLGLPATVRGPLKELLSACKEARVSMRVSSTRETRGWRELSAAQIEAAASMIGEGVLSDTQERYHGTMVGLNLLGKRASFAMRLQDKLIEGAAALIAEEEEARALAERFAGRECWALVSVTAFERRGVRGERHVLLDVAGSEEELESEEEG